MKEALRILTPGMADILIGGPPCQSFSNARSGGYSEGYRDCSGISEILNFVSALDIVKPKLFIMENAPTLLEQPSMNQNLQNILRLFRDSGYIVSPELLSTEEYGVPQQRKRTFFLGTRVDFYAKGMRFRKPEGIFWTNKWTGWAHYLGLPEEGLLVRRGNALKGKNPYEAAYTVISADLINIRYSVSAKLVGTLTKLERLGQDQRPLTIEELARLQGFPPTYEFTGSLDSQRLQVGNAWSFNVASALAKEARRSLEH